VTTRRSLLLTDERGHTHLVTLSDGGTLHTRHGWIPHEQIAAAGDGGVVTSSLGMTYLVTSATVAEQIVRMPRGAAVIYPKDIAVMLSVADIGPGDVVVEAGAGSGALTTALLRAVGPAGGVVSVELRPDFAAVARRNVARLLGQPPANWRLIEGDLSEVGAAAGPSGSVDAVALDMLAPWECLAAAASLLRPGGHLVCYLATTTQVSRLAETVRVSELFCEPRVTETIERGWHVVGLAVRPEHRMVGHTGFVLHTRRLAEGVRPLPRRGRPAKGAYGPDYHGPRATLTPEEEP